MTRLTPITDPQVNTQDEAHHRAPAGARAGTQVRVLLDPDDDVAVTRGLLNRHDPTTGRVVVHPTPATRAPAALGHDVLGALGAAVNRLGPDRLVGNRRAWHAAAAWTAAGRVSDLVVLRADRLAPAGWNQLLTLSRATGARLTLICHTPTIPADLAAVLDEADHQLLTTLTELELPASGHGADAASRVDGPGPAERPDEAALPRFTYPNVTSYRLEAFIRLDAAGFARTDFVYQHAQTVTARWLDTRCASVDTATSRQAATLFLTELVHDSPSRTHTLARLRGAQAAFRWAGLHLAVPSTRLVLDVLGGPGLTSAPFTPDLAARIRAGTANPLLAAAVTLVLVTGMEPLTLATLPWVSLTPDNDALHVTWTDGYRQLHVPDPALRQTTAWFHVPTTARPLLQAARHFTASGSRDTARAGRMFATIPFSPDQLSAAAANGKVPLSGRATDLALAWQTTIRIERVPWFGGPHDIRFSTDQHFDPADATPLDSGLPELTQSRAVKERVTRGQVGRARLRGE